jgi:predicted nucleotidyltransferase
MIILDNIPKSAHRFIRKLASLPQVERLILFGSRAVGDNDPRADIDLAVSAPALSRWQFAHLRVSAFEAPTLYWISLVHLQQMPETLLERINQQGKVIYEPQETS